MLNLLKQLFNNNSFLKIKKEAAKLDEPIPEIKSITSEKIHQDFLNWVNWVDKFSKVLHPISDDEYTIYEKSLKLEELGFRESDTNKEGRLIEGKMIENNKKKFNQEVIEYFTKKYPNYRLIDLHGLDTLCKKYNLKYYNVESYEGSVLPILTHLENFKIDDNDSCFYKLFNGYHYILSKLEVDELEENKKRDFRKTPMEIISENSILKEPILLIPVLYKKVKFYLIPKMH